MTLLKITIFVLKLFKEFKAELPPFIAVLPSGVVRRYVLTQTEQGDGQQPRDACMTESIIYITLSVPVRITS